MLKNIMNNIKIRDIEVYHGSKIVDNSYYIEHFKKLGKDIRHFWEDILGRKYRYHIDSSKENSLTMAVNVCNKLLEKCNLKGSDIDMIIYSSVLPEYVAPPSSLILHSILKGKQSCLCHDINVNCVGMIYSLDYIYRYMSSNDKINRVLLVGSDYLNPQVRSDNEYCYGQYGDAACAVILERTSEDSKFLGSNVSVFSDSSNDIRFPACGFSHIYTAKPYEMLTKWGSIDSSWLDDAVTNIASLIHENGLNVNDISMFCLSQFAYSNIHYIREHMNIPEDKSIYIGDQYGYTGTSSPFIAFYEAIKRGKIKRGDYIMFWTLGAGVMHMAVLIKY